MPRLFLINGQEIKVSYFLFSFFCLLLVKRRNIFYPSKLLVFFFIFVCTYSFLLSFIYYDSFGFSDHFFHWVYGAGVVIIVFNLFPFSTERDISLFFQKIWFILFLCILFNNCNQLDSITNYLKNNLNHPSLTTLVVGGVNSESIFLGLFCASFVYTRIRWFILFLSLAVSVFYSSRAGVISDCITCLFFIFFKQKHLVNKKFIVIITLFSIILLVVFFTLISYADTSGNFFSRFISRFSRIGEEPGSIGRLNMWSYIPELISTYPFGVGLGNSLLALKSISHDMYRESNLHNIYLQMIVDLGVFCGLLFNCLIFYFLYHEGRNIFCSLITFFLCSYFFMGLIQFAGGESFFFFFIGLYLLNKCRKN
ncbi:O-antigen ligase family protein [Succinivibrio dextrinosolvens]|uniref:O-Antigen ligase n=1 Tax=Succinivibrio dextrinosolvens TaxID=83771 RepID=A0A662ZFE2_9GAMM|nr:O-antigen ligase family protein [Succinivibrio dextrinosolvens]SFK59231.1 O-Antigen ligase [Succinivibrio dextrinosolvens]